HEARRGPRLRRRAPHRGRREGSSGRRGDDARGAQGDEHRMSDEIGAPSAFSVELPIFVGPFKLLTDLILDQKVDVCDVPIATVTDRFLEHAKDAERWTLEEATWFLAACAVLLELKVGRLMPRHEVLDEEDLLGISPDLVYARSLELPAIRRVALELAAP